MSLHAKHVKEPVDEDAVGKRSVRAQRKVKSHADAPRNVALDMGWGRLLFAQTFESNKALVKTLCNEKKGDRDVAFYLRDPHVVLSLAPHKLFLDPSHTFRITPPGYRQSERKPETFTIRRAVMESDMQGINRIYAGWQMVTCPEKFMLQKEADDPRSYLVAVADDTGEIVGTVTWVDHVRAFDDMGEGASLWCLAVDPQAQYPGVGEWLVRTVVEEAFARGRKYLDLSVMHDNEQAVALYEKLGFYREPIFCIKHKNPINEPLFVAPTIDETINPYARIIIDEARRRGIGVEVIDAEASYFKLHFGGRAVICRESLTELTSAISMSRCDDKRVTRRIFEKAGLSVPAQQPAGSRESNDAFLQEYERVVVKPARGEQGVGICVDIRDSEELDQAVREARTFCPDVILEQFVTGQDLRVIVINEEVVAAAVRRPAIISGTGEHSVRQLMEKYNRRRMAATEGESQVPFDGETLRCLRLAGFDYNSVPASGENITLRKAANLHTGGTIHDVTEQLHPELARAAVEAAKALDIGVVGLDFIAPKVSSPQYVLIEANERPGLANHEPAPTAQKFIDYLFPQTADKRPV